MKRGKQTCRILKEIRKQIAETNDIEFITSECQYQGDCSGTCPKCESEVRYLEQQLEYKRMAGKAITILGISTSVLTMAPLASSCTNSANKGNEVVVVDANNPDDGEELFMLGEPAALENHIEISKKDTFDIVDQMPQFPGGQEKLMKFLTVNIKDLKIAHSECLPGRVIVQFVVDKDGSILNPRVIRGVDPFLDKEALRVVKLMPKWIPGALNGKKVMVRYTVPVMFRLQ